MNTYLKSLNNALLRVMRRDERVYLLGEDLADPYGGAFKVTRGLSTQFPDRVLCTPISEAGITGLAVGMAVRGLRPVVEIMFGDFITLAVDQLVNHAAKFHGMYAGKVDVPLVVRIPMGGGRGYGPTHSQSLEKMFLGTPGLTVVAPSHYHDPGAMLEHAIMNNDSPVLFIEHKLLYPEELVLENRSPLFIEPRQGTGYPTVTVSNFDPGTSRPDVALVTYGGMSRVVEKVLLELYREEIWAVAILPSLLSAPPNQKELKALDGCRRVLVIEEGTGPYGWGAEVAASICRYAGTRSPVIRRVYSAASVIPAARHLEDAVIPSVQRVVDTVWEVLE